MAERPTDERPAAPPGRARYHMVCLANGHYVVAVAADDLRRYSRARAKTADDEDLFAGDHFPMSG